MSNIKHSYPGQWGTPHRDGEFTCMGDLEPQDPPEGNAIVGAFVAIGITAAIAALIYIGWNGMELIANWAAR